MGYAVQTIGGSATLAAAPVYKAITTAAGDSLTVPNFPNSTSGRLDQAYLYGAAGPGSLRILSPRLYDDTYGISLETDDNPSAQLLPDDVSQELYPGDTLTVEVNGTASDAYTAALTFRYDDYPGISQQLKSPGDIMGHVTDLIARRVATTSSATIGDWSDTLITATEDFYKADQYMAVLGYHVSAPQAAVAIKCPETGNLRVGGPGVTRADVTHEWFVRESTRRNAPYIPVFKTNNANLAYVSTLDSAASTGVVVDLVLGVLDSTFTLS